ncbi:MAG TPA: hypothetical protein O0X39_06105 [Methanocorpusculum sp.]|nr:hypothetical protein [Methanocorpusculum sp.]
MQKRDDAVSPVVAMMLILAVIAICVSVMFATYVPDLKENAEILHSKEVKEEFFKFASDVDNLFTNGRSGVYSYIIPLGGGDTLLSPSKSAGTLQLGRETIGEITIEGYVDGSSVTDTYMVYNTPVTYTPLLSFWENQGYKYGNETVYVTKGTVEIPALEGVSDTEAEHLASRTTLLKYMEPQKIYWYTGHDSVTHDTFTMNIISVENEVNESYISGNGEAVLTIRKGAETTIKYDPVYSITIQPYNGMAYSPSLPHDSEVIVTCITAKVSVQ